MGRVGDLLDMTGRAVLITGGAGHVGRTAAATFAELGASVAVLDLEIERCEHLCRTISGEFGSQAIAIACDLEQADDIPAAVEAAHTTLGRLDTVVNCAAFVGTSDIEGWIGDLSEQTDAAFARALAVNVGAPFALSRAAAPALAESPGGSIINLSSIYGLVGPDMRLYEDLSMGNPAGYAASKGGLEQLTRWLATVLAPHVRVNAIAPGGIARDQPAAFQDRYVARTPMGRMATEDDLRGAFAYLGSDLSRYVTGQTIVVDGGWTTW